MHTKSESDLAKATLTIGNSRTQRRGWVCRRTGQDAAFRDVLRCRPPIHGYAENSRDGLSLLRWILHRILPYPTFLYDDRHLAARIRVEVSSLRRALDSSARLRELFSPAQYTGGGSGILGRRWWRAGIEAIIFGANSDDPSNITTLHVFLTSLASDLIAESDDVLPVLTSGMLDSDDLVRAKDVTEVAPDDWPPFADSAWIRRSDVAEDPMLRAIAIDLNEGA